MDPLSLTVSIIALAKTTGAITSAICSVASNDAHAGIKNLSVEFRHTYDAVEQLRLLAENSSRVAGINQNLRRFAQEVVSDTQRTLTELRERIDRLQPRGKSTGPFRSLQCRTRYQWSEKAIRSLLLHLQARRSALSLVVDLFTRAEARAIQADTAEIKRRLDDINSQLAHALTKDRIADLPPVAEGDAVGGENATTDDDTASILDSGISVGSQSTHARSGSLASSSRTSLSSFTPPLLRETDPLRLMQASSGREIQLAHRRHAAAAAADHSRGITQAQGQNFRTLVRRLSAAEVSAKGLTSLETASAALALAKAYRDAGLFDIALQYYHDALAAREVALGPHHLTTLNTLDSIAQVHEIRFEWADALAYYQSSLSARRDNPTVGEQHPSALMAATKVAKMQQHLGQYEDAAAQYSKILSIYTAQDRINSLPALSVRSHVAGVHHVQGRLDDATAEYNTVKRQAEQTKGGERLVEEANAALAAIQLSRMPQTVGDPTALTQVTSANDEPEANDIIISACREELERLRILLGKAHPDTLAKMYELAAAYDSEGQHQNAIGWFSEVVTGRTQVFGPHHPSTTVAMHEMASSYEQLGNLDKALEHYHAALIGRETVLGDDHPHTLSTVVAIASIYSAQNDSNVARDLLLRAIDGFTRAYGEDHSATLSARYKLADVYREKGMIPQSLEIHKDVLARRTATVGPENPATLNSENALGCLFRLVECYEMAITHFRRALDGRETCLGRFHSMTTSTALQLASAYWKSGAPQEALTYYQMALEGLEYQEPDSRMAGLTTRSNIALCHYKLEDYPQAFLWYSKVLTVQEEEFGKNHADAIYTAEQVAHTCMETEDLEKAIELFQRVLTFKENESPADGASWAFILFQLASACFQRGTYEDSLSWSRRLVALKERSPPEQRLVTMWRMGVIYVRQSKFDEALDQYQKTHEECEVTLADDHWLRKRCLDGIADVYFQMDNKTMAQQDYKKTIDIIQKRLDKNDLNAITLLYKFADVHLEQFQYREALNLYMSVLEAVENSTRFQEQNFKDIRHAAISDIANCHMKLADNNKALEYLAMLLSCDDPTHHLGALVRIGNTQERLCQIPDAIETYTHILELETAQLGAQHKDPLTSTLKIGSLYSRASRYQDALTWTNRALAGLRSLGADAEVETCQTLDMLCSIYCRLGRFNDAIRVQKEAMEGFERCLGPMSPSTLRACLDLAEVYRMLERREEALELYQRALRGYEARVREVRGEEKLKEQKVVRELQGKIRQVSMRGRQV